MRKKTIAEESAERARLEEVARGNVERHLGDVVDGDGSADAVYDEAYTLAFDALHDAGAEDGKAREIAQSVAMCYAQP